MAGITAEDILTAQQPAAPQPAPAPEPAHEPDPAEPTRPAVAVDTVQLDVHLGHTCACGCGQPPADKSSRLRRGHFQTLRGHLMRAHAEGRSVTFTDETGARVETGVRGYASRVCTAKGMAEMEESLARVTPRTPAPLVIEPGAMIRVRAEGDQYNALICRVRDGAPTLIVFVGDSGPMVTDEFTVLR